MSSEMESRIPPININVKNTTEKRPGHCSETDSHRYIPRSLTNSVFQKTEGLYKVIRKKKYPGLNLESIAQFEGMWMRL